MVRLRVVTGHHFSTKQTILRQIPVRDCGEHHFGHSHQELMMHMDSLPVGQILPIASEYKTEVLLIHTQFRWSAALAQ